MTIVSILLITFLLIFGLGDNERETMEKSAHIQIYNQCSDLAEVQIEIEMYDFDPKTDTFITRYTSYENISIEPGEAGSYIFKPPESIDSGYLDVQLSCSVGKNFDYFSHSSTWASRKDDTYKIFETEDGIKVDFLDW